MAILPPPPINVPITTNTGSGTPPWNGWFVRLWNRIGQSNGGIAPSDATYITQTPSTELDGEQALSLLTSGFLKVTTGSGVITSSNDPLIQTTDLSPTGVIPASYTINGSTLFTVDYDGRITSASNQTVTAIPSGSAGGDLSGTYPNPSVVKIQGVAIDSTHATAVSNLSGTNTGDQTTVSGNAGSATTTNTTDDTTTNATMYPVWKTSTSGNLAEKVSSTKLTFNPSTGTLTSTTFVGALTGNASTVTTNANLTGDVTSSGNATTIGAGKVTEAMQVLADNTTNNVSTTKHGYVPKAPNIATQYLDGTGAYSVPAGSFTSPTWTTYTPAVTLVGGAGNTVPVYTTNVGRYLTIGKIVHVRILLDGDGGAEGAGTGHFYVSLPIAAGTNPSDAGFNFSAIKSCGYAGNNATEYELYGRIASTESNIRLYYFNLISTTARFTGADQNNTARTISLDFTYEIN